MEEEEIESPHYTIKWRDLLRNLKSAGVTPNTDIMFGNGNLEFHRTKDRGDNLVQIQFNQPTWPAPIESDNIEFEKRRQKYVAQLKRKRKP